MNDFTKETESELTSLSHTLGSHMKQLATILGKGANIKPRHAKLPKRLKAPDSITFSGILGSMESSLGIKSSSINSSKASGGQSMADLAAAIQKSIMRDL